MNDDQNSWIAISDVMSALMMIFMFIAISFLYQLLSEKEIYKVSLNQALHEEFDKDLQKWQAHITEDNIMRFNSPFKAGSSEVPGDFQLILADYFPRYIKILTRNKFKNEIEEIRVEGHTSYGWGASSHKKEIYLKNMELSQVRASNVLALCYDLNDDAVINNSDWLEINLRANGMSFSKLLHRADSAEQDEEKSRRVEFRVVTKEYVAN